MVETFEKTQGSPVNLSTLLHGLATGERHPNEDLLASFLHAARQHLGMEVGFISEFTSTRRMFRVVDAVEDRADVVRPGASDPLDETYCQRCVDGRLPRLIPDAQILPAAQELSVTRDLGIGAHLSVPVTLSDGTVYGTFCCFSFHADHSLTERDLAYLQAFADVAGHLVEHEVEQRRKREEKRVLIRSVLDDGGMNMAWQRIVDARQGKCLGFEALARFPDPDGGRRTPDWWFREAGELGMGDELEQMAVRRGLQLLEWAPDDLYVSVNMSSRAVLAMGVERVLRDWPLERLVLEITEHDAVQDYAALDQVLAPLRQRGLRLAVDDLGAGYASLQHLLRIKPDLLKVDISLTRDVDRDTRRQALISGLVRYATTSGSRVVAEGVETEAERNVLAELNVDAIQGYLVARPQPAREAMAGLQ